jgi:hypothetical protein
MRLFCILLPFEIGPTTHAPGHSLKGVQDPTNDAGQPWLEREPGGRRVHSELPVQASSASLTRLVSKQCCFEQKEMQGNLQRNC